MGNFTNKLNKSNCQQANKIRRNIAAEHKWASDQIQQNIKHAMDDYAKIHTQLDNHNKTAIKSNYSLFSDDTSIDINNITHMKPLLDIYNESSNE